MFFTEGDEQNLGPNSQCVTYTVIKINLNKATYGHVYNLQIYLFTASLKGPLLHYISLHTDLIH